jgi:hypothetical protein
MKTMHKLFIFVLVATCVAIPIACAELCEKCFTKSLQGDCVLVEPFTDPNNDCDEFCGIKAVCGAAGHCVLQSKPECVCDYASGRCDIPESKVDTAYSQTSIVIYLAAEKVEEKIENITEYSLPAEVVVFTVCLLSSFIVAIVLIFKISESPSAPKANQGDVWNLRKREPE